MHSWLQKRGNNLKSHDKVVILVDKTKENSTIVCTSETRYVLVNQ